MSNLTITNNDLGNVIHADACFDDALLTFASAGTIKEGTILARNNVTGNLVPYVTSGGANGNDVPKAVVTYDVTVVAPTDEPIRAMVSGKVNKARLVVDADGDNSNITDAILDQLRSYGIIAQSVADLSKLDNQ